MARDAPLVLIAREDGVDVTGAVEDADELDTDRSGEGAIEKHVTIDHERADTSANFRPRTADSRSTREHARHVAHSHHEPSGCLPIVLGDVVADCLKIVLRLGRDDKSRHAPRLALSALSNSFGEHALAVQTFAAIELVEANRDVSTQSRRAISCCSLASRRHESAPQVARVAEAARLATRLRTCSFSASGREMFKRCGSQVWPRILLISD